MVTPLRSTSSIIKEVMLQFDNVASNYIIEAIVLKVVLGENEV